MRDSILTLDVGDPMVVVRHGCEANIRVLHRLRRIRGLNRVNRVTEAESVDDSPKTVEAHAVHSRVPWISQSISWTAFGLIVYVEPQRLVSLDFEFLEGFAMK